MENVLCWSCWIFALPLALFIMTFCLMVLTIWLASLALYWTGYLVI